MRRLVPWAAGAALLILTGCKTPERAAPLPTAPAPTVPDTRPAPRPEPVRPRPEPAEPSAPAPSLFEVMGLSALPGWADADHAQALEAYKAACGVSREVAAQAVCNRARLLRDNRDARRFFEDNFRVQVIEGAGVLTAYFAPQYEARRTRGGEFTAPVRPTPSDLRPGQAYATRTAIDQRPARDALAWMRAEDLFFLQVQGSGTLVFENGERKKAVFAAHNSRPFAGIANPMRDRGLLPADNTSGDAIRQWLADNRGERADEIMRINPRYVFFRLEEDDGRDPAGAAGVPLPAGHAIAVDPEHHRYGDVYWIDGRAPILAGAFPVYRRLVVALDTGGAIRGEVRADLYLGKGDAAGREAGRVRHELRMYRLVPRG